MTPADFRKKATRVFLERNPTAKVGWTKQPRLVTYPTGVTGWEWTFYATASGHKERMMLAQGDETYVMVR
jgi:hypothetical protein